MFYLTFENSKCKDYVTEKFFAIQQLDIVPIVMGGANYSAIAPRGSYIALCAESEVRKAVERSPYAVSLKFRVFFLFLKSVKF